jgi:hypothetical protein
MRCLKESLSGTKEKAAEFIRRSHLVLSRS